MEPQHAEVLRPRSQGRDPVQMGRRPGEKAIDTALEKLIHEAEANGKKPPD